MPMSDNLQTGTVLFQFITKHREIGAFFVKMKEFK